MPLASSLDHIGPIVRSTWDAAAVLQAIAGFDEMDDSTSETPVPNYIELISEEISDEFKVGIPNQYFFDLIDPKVKDVFEKFVDKLNNCEIITRHIDLDETDKIRDTWKAIRLGESAAVHDKWMKTRPNDYGDDVISMLTKGLEITATEYINAKKRMGKIRESIITAMKGFDALIVPTTIIAATLVDQKSVDIDGKDVEVYQALSRQTIAFSTAGLPVLNVPAGLVEGKLPVGVQLIGRPFDEETLFKIARKYELHYKITELFTPFT
jgi:aspartyl-tRNA(Asn)/glutamyl-tRNA(Gln) amidotransferase subunit A